MKMQRERNPRLQRGQAKRIEIVSLHLDDSPQPVAGIINKDRGKKTGKKTDDREKEEKDLKKAESGLEDEDEVTMIFVAQKLKDSCSD